MKQAVKAQKTARLMLAAALLLCFILIIQQAMGVPEGAAITYISNSSRNSTQPENRTDEKGAIHTITLDSVQQNMKWKAYVGNVSGRFVLRDAQSYAIYEWDAIGSPSGTLFATRDGDVTWSNIMCVNSTNPENKTNEDTALSHNSANADSINGTFDEIIHKSFDVGAYNIPENCSYSLVTYVNDTQQTHSVSSLFQEMLLSDGDSLIFATILEQNANGYRNDPSNENITYDFQILIPDSGNEGGGPFTYYFYVEIT